VQAGRAGSFKVRELTLSWSVVHRSAPVHRRVNHGKPERKLNLSNEKDEPIDRLLTAIHRRGDAAASADCLDAETLATWMDGQLGGPMLARAEAHAAACAHCQSLLAAMARTGDAEIQAHAGEPVPRWSFWPTLRWAAPLAAAATAAALYVAVRPDPSGELAVEQIQSRSVARSDAAQVSAESPTAAATRESARSAEAVRQKTPTTEMDARSDRPGERTEAQTRSALAGPRRDEEERLRAAAKSASPSQAKADKDTAARSLGDTAPLPRVGELQAAPSAPAPAASAPPAPATPPPPPPQMELSRSATATFADANKPGGGAVPVAAGRGLTVAPIVIPTPDPAIRWRILAGTVVQFSSDRETTWTAQDVGQVAQLTAGAAPSPTVCWIVGRGGTVLLTTDGRTWQRLTFPEPADLVRIVASDANAATVTTTDGRTFATTDGGRTWR
jgi:hypothetical protein